MFRVISVGNSMFCFGFGMKTMSHPSKVVHKAIGFQCGINHHTSSINACYDRFVVLNFTHLFFVLPLAYTSLDKCCGFANCSTYNPRKFTRNGKSQVGFETSFLRENTESELYIPCFLRKVSRVLNVPQSISEEFN